MKVITIGRAPEGNDIVINDPMVSRHHFQIVQNDDGSYRLADFGSTNGTYINGRKVKGEVALEEDDIIRVGNTIIPWRQYFSDDITDFSKDVDSSDDSSVIQTGQTDDGNGGNVVWRVIGIIISLIMIIGGLSGTLVLKGTNSSTALAAVGGVLLLIEIVLLVVSNKNNNN